MQYFNFTILSIKSISVIFQGSQYDSLPALMFGASAFLAAFSTVFCPETFGKNLPDSLREAKDLWDCYLFQRNSVQFDIIICTVDWIEFTGAHATDIAHAYGNVHWFEGYNKTYWFNSDHNQIYPSILLDCKRFHVFFHSFIYFINLLTYHGILLKRYSYQCKSQNVYVEINAWLCRIR